MNITDNNITGNFITDNTITDNIIVNKMSYSDRLVSFKFEGNSSFNRDFL